MIYNKQPLIYIPRKKNTKKTLTQSLGSILLTTQWLYSPTVSSNPSYATMPQRISISPTTTTSHIGTDNKVIIKYNSTNGYYSLFPIVANSSYNFKQVGDLMRWLSIYPIPVNSGEIAPFGFSQAFILLPGASYVYKLCDSTRTNRYRPYNIRLANDASITVDSTLSIVKNKFNDTGYLNKAVTALSNHGLSTNEGLLVLVESANRYYELTDDQLLEYSSGIQNSSFGHHTGVIDLDIA